MHIYTGGAHIFLLEWARPICPGKARQFARGRANSALITCKHVRSPILQSTLHTRTPFHCILQVAHILKFAAWPASSLQSGAGCARAALQRPTSASRRAGRGGAGARRAEQPQRIVLAAALGQQASALAQDHRSHAEHEEVRQSAGAAVHGGARRDSLVHDRDRVRPGAGVLLLAGCLQPSGVAACAKGSTPPSVIRGAYAAPAVRDKDKCSAAEVLVPQIMQN